MSTDRQIVSVIPVDPLQSLTTYSFTMSGIRDLAGNATGFTSLTFTTGVGVDGGGPVVVEVSPAAGQGGVPVNARLAPPAIAAVTAVGPAHLERFGTIERRFEPPAEHRVVETSIVVDAEAAAVWREIVEVPAIYFCEDEGTMTRKAPASWAGDWPPWYVERNSSDSRRCLPG